MRCSVCGRAEIPPDPEDKGGVSIPVHTPDCPRGLRLEAIPDCSHCGAWPYRPHLASCSRN